MVSKARLDLPEPESPVMQIRRFRGRRTVMSLRLCSRAPWTTSSSAAMEAPLYFSERVFGRGSSVLRDPVRQDAPGSGVARRWEEIAPVLDHEPGPGSARERGGAGQLPGVGEAAPEDGPEQREAEGELVDPQAAHVDARAEPVTLQAKHFTRVCRPDQLSVKARFRSPCISPGRATQLISRSPATTVP